MEKKAFRKKIQGPGRRAILLAAVVCLLTTAGITRAETTDGNIVETVVPATCTEDGYRAVEDREKHTTDVQKIPATGHRFSEWVRDEDKMTQTRRCELCGYTETVRTDDIPTDRLARLYLTGSMGEIGKKQKAVLEADFSGEGEAFRCYAIMTVQGHSTFGMPKKNYTIRFFDDPDGEQKHKVTFGKWRNEHKYILKSNYTDLTQSRNLAAASVWEDMTDCRDGVSPRILETPTLGAVEGFPVTVYLNGAFFGLYTLNLHKDDDLYRMEKGVQEALVICNAQTTDESLFRAPAAFEPDYSSDWEIEFCGTADETWAKESFNGLIDFVMNATDEEFRASLDQRLDADAAIDYLIFIYAMGLSHSGAKDLVMLNYDGRWIPTAFDMDEAFGLDAQAFRYLAPEAFVPVKTDGKWDSGTDSLLWDRLLQNYETEIRERYAWLRQDVLTEEKINGKIDSITNQISVSIYDMDHILFPDRPVDDWDMKKQIRQYVKERLAVMDQVFGGARQ